MSDSLEQARRRRNASGSGFPPAWVRRIAESETRGPFRASQSWRVVMMITKISVAIAVLALALGAGAVSAPTVAAQDKVVRVDGLVQWIGGGQMIVQADTGPSVGV